MFVADELDLGFARTWVARKIEERVERWYRELQRSVDLLVVPEFGADRGILRFVGPIVSPPTATPGRTREKYGLPPGRMVLFAMSGSGFGRELALRTADALRGSLAKDCFLAVTGNRGARIEGENVFDLGVVPDNQNLVASADLVISTAGKSTIDEAASAGVPAVVIPIRYHAEQERNASALGYSYGDRERLGDLVASKLGRREKPREFLGGEAASRLILSLA